MAIAVPEFQFVCDLVKTHSGIVLETGKEYLVESRLRPIVASEGCKDFSELVSRVKAGGAGPLRQKVVTAMTTNETSFFRDQTPFDALQQQIIPELIAKRSTQRSLNIWCAASSTGQEPYSVCMLLCEHFPQLASWNVKFLATDLSNDVLARARAGVFNQIEINRGLPARLMVKYFKKQGLDWIIDERIRKMVEFRPLNLMENWPPMSSLDIVFIRNVLIYFDTEAKRTILGRIRRVMAPDGVLFLGGAETTLGIDDAFSRKRADRSGCYELTPTGGNRG